MSRENLLNAPAQRKAIIAMSGGVDSSVAALLCQRQGFDCMGVTLKLYDNQDAGLGEASFPGEKTCCSVDDVADARSVAFRLGMPFYVFNFKEAFRREVMDRFAAAYQHGETPNPCVDCNRYIKFEKLMRRGEEIGYPYVATGHYARVERDETTGRWLLKKGLDENKDQSYMLYSLTQWELSRLLLPPGGADQRPDPGLGRGERLCQRSQAGQPGHLLCARRGLRCLYPPLDWPGVPSRGVRGHPRGGVRHP